MNYFTRTSYFLRSYSLKLGITNKLNKIILEIFIDGIIVVEDDIRLHQVFKLDLFIVYIISMINLYIIANKDNNHNNENSIGENTTTIATNKHISF